jgi:hypothetical protein
VVSNGLICLKDRSPLDCELDLNQPMAPKKAATKSIQLKRAGSLRSSEKASQDVTPAIGRPQLNASVPQLHLNVNRRGVRTLIGALSY